MLRFRPPVQTRESTKEGSQGKLLRGLLGSGVFALVVAAVYAYLSLAGVIDILAARIVLFLGWLTAVVGVLVSETLCEQSVKHRIIYTVSTALIVFVAFIALDAWTLGYRANQQAGLSKKDILDTIKDGLSGNAKLSENLEIKVLRKDAQEQKEITPESAEAKSSEKEYSIQPKPTKEPELLWIEMAPRVVHYVLTYKSDGETGRQNEYGFAAIIRVRNEGKSLQQIKSLEITGDVEAGSSYGHAFGLGKTSEEIDIEYGERKPYLRLSFVAYPINVNKIEAAGEEFIRFMILDPTKLGTQGITRGTEVEKYIGFKGEKAAEPKILQTVPSISFFVQPTGFVNVRPGNAQWTAVKARDEIKSGRLKFTVQFNSGPQVVIPSKITNSRLIGLDDWNKQTPQDIFFDTDRRFIPVEKDPLVERPRR